MLPIKMNAILYYMLINLVFYGLKKDKKIMLGFKQILQNLKSFTFFTIYQNLFKKIE